MWLSNLILIGLAGYYFDLIYGLEQNKIDPTEGISGGVY